MRGSGRLPEERKVRIMQFEKVDTPIEVLAEDITKKLRVEDVNIRKKYQKKQTLSPPC